MRVLADRLGGRLPVEPERSEQRSVIVIGAGITGLVAAYELRRRGVSVMLYEASKHAGGNTRTTLAGGFLAEHGAHSTEATDAFEDLVLRLDLHRDLQEVSTASQRRFVVRNGRIEELPNSLSSLIRSRLLSMRAKLRLLCEPFAATMQEEHDESVASFIERRLGREALEYAAEPLLLSLSAGRAESTSMAHTFPQLHQMERQHGSITRALLARRAEARGRQRLARVAGEPVPAPPAPRRVVSFRYGMQTLTSALERSLLGTIKFDCPVRLINRNDSRWIVDAGQDDATRSFSFDAVVLALPAHAIAAMELPATIRRYAAPVEQVEYPPVSAITFGFPRAEVSNALDGWGIMVPSCEQRSLLGVMFNSTLFEGRAPEGYVNLTCYVGGARRPETARKASTDLIERSMIELRELLGVKGEPIFSRHSFLPRAVPQYSVGHGDVKRAADCTELANPGLYLAGNYRNGFAVGDSVTSGRQVAERVATYLARAS